MNPGFLVFSPNSLWNSLFESLLSENLERIFFGEIERCQMMLRT